MARRLHLILVAGVLIFAPTVYYWILSPSASILTPTVQRVPKVLSHVFNRSILQTPSQNVFDHSLRYPNGSLSFVKPGASIDIFRAVEANAVTTYDGALLENFVFVSAASDNHFMEMLKGVSRIQINDPGRTIIIYDIGLNPENVAMVQSLKYVKYRRFNFSIYPDHTQRLKGYAWKPMIILDVLRTQKAIMWVDSSIRVESNDYGKVFNKLLKSSSYVMMLSPGHSVYAVTHPGMYEYLPTNTEALKSVECYAANSMFIVNTEENCRDIFWWYYLCALTENCIAPTKQLICDFQKKIGSAYTDYGNCHRFDQALINLLLSNKFHFNGSTYHLHQNIFKARRGDKIKFDEDVLLAEIN